MHVIGMMMKLMRTHVIGMDFTVWNTTTHLEYELAMTGATARPKRRPSQEGGAALSTETAAPDFSLLICSDLVS
jgi:hypothetical protein